MVRSVITLKNNNGTPKTGATVQIYEYDENAQDYRGNLIGQATEIPNKGQYYLIMTEQKIVTVFVNNIREESLTGVILEGKEFDAAGRVKDGTISINKLTQAARDEIRSGGNITNNPDDVTLRTNGSNQIELHPDYKNKIDGDGISSNPIDKVGMYAHLKNRNEFNVKDFGAKGDGVTDDTQAIQNAIDYVTTLNETIYSGVIGGKARVIGEGKFKITSTITLSCDADFRNATFIVPSSFASVALRVQSNDGVSYLQLNNTYLPTVKVEAMVDNWPNASTGIEVTSVIDSRIFFNEVWYFQTGIKITTLENKGCSYNEFHLNSVRNNKIGLHIFPNTGGWTNENNFYGGRIRIDSGFSDYTGTVLLRLTGNNNVFYKLSLEGNYDETKIWLDGYNYNYGCSYNKFINLRPESSSKWKLKVDGSQCLRNIILDGYITDFASEVNYEIANSATSEAIQINISRELIKTGADENGIFKLQNKTSDSYPIFTFFSLNVDPKTNPTGWTSSISSTGAQWKASYTYTYPYFKIDPVLRGVRFPRANLDPDIAPYIKTDYLDGEYQLTLGDGSVRIVNHSWDGNCFILGSYYLWVDSSGDLRIKNGKPTSDTDGTVVGAQS